MIYANSGMGKAQYSHIAAGSVAASVSTVVFWYQKGYNLPVWQSFLVGFISGIIASFVFFFFTPPLENVRAMLYAKISSRKRKTDKTIRIRLIKRDIKMWDTNTKQSASYGETINVPQKTGEKLIKRGHAERVGQ